ncbi:MAG TPA: DUF2076 family protein [Acetobacteraceae bacterium]|jgi:uncharacterized protein|nr:DUF2076 family protein [Acetobacteraceae bacterium]
MTNEERDIISQFIARVGGAPAGGQSSMFSGSVPATTQPALPPVDPDADSLIRQMFQRYPEAPYRITQLAFIEEHALAEAQNRIQRLEWELQQAKQAAQQAPQQQQSSGSGGGFFSGLFGGGRSQSAPQPGPGPAWNQGGAMPPPQPQYQQAPPPPQYPPSYQPGMFQPQGSGFLGGALRTAAGVAGGVVAGNLLMDLFSGRRGEGGGFAGGSPVAPMGESPWGGGLPQQNYVDQGSWDNSGGGGMPTDQNYVDNGSWDQPTDNSGGSGSDSNSNDSSWDSGGGDSSWDSSGGGSDSLC